MDSLADYTDAKKYLPHRHPILMIDKWLNLNNTEVKAIFEIPEDCIFLKDNELQESGLIEHTAQTCSTIIGETIVNSYDNPEDAKPIIGFISNIKKMNIYKLPKAQQQLKSHAKLVARFDTDDYCICTVACEIHCNEVLLMDSVMNLFIQEVK